MIVAINKDSIKAVKQKPEFNYIYVFDNEPLKELQKLNIVCKHISIVEEVDINLTNYNIPAIKTTTLNEKEWWKLPEVKQNKFAIIVPNYNNNHGDYNGKTFLQNCIESVLNQTYTNFDLIIVDDMSTDNSVEIVENYVDNRIHLIKNKRKRYNGGSRNVGIEYALDNLDFDYFCFLDSDDWWANDTVLETINRKLNNCEMMVIGCKMIYCNGKEDNFIQEFKTFQELFISQGKVWCTAWSRVIRRDKIVFFCEDTLMEDRVWTYRQTDNINFDKVINLKKICYVWNRLNTTNSVSMNRNKIWDASAYCHIGHQLQLIETLKHKEMIPEILRRIEECKNRISQKKYDQY